MRILITENQYDFLKESIKNYEPCVRGGSTQIHPEDKTFFKKLIIGCTALSVSCAK